MATGKRPKDTDLDSLHLAHTTQITKGETVDAADVIQVDIEYGSFVSSSEDPIQELPIQALAKEEEKVGQSDDNINNEYDINSERATDDVKAKLLVAMASDIRRENRILQKLLRAPRYFDYPESSWLACSEFSEDDKKDTAKKGHKSCYICGDINHSGNRCKKVNPCTICSGGHQVRDCPTKNVEVDCASTLCLKCGNTDHDMFSCTNDYDSEDLKAIECYTCKQTGHLCCVEKKTEGSTAASCYICGQSGHFGLDCTKSNVVTFHLQLFCRRCKERGHSRKQCPKKAKKSMTISSQAKFTKRGGAATRAERRKLYKSRRRKNHKQTLAGDTSSSQLLAVAGPSCSNTMNNHPQGQTSAPHTRLSLQDGLIGFTRLRQ